MGAMIEERAVLFQRCFRVNGLLQIAVAIASLPSVDEAIAVVLTGIWTRRAMGEDALTVFSLSKSTHARFAGRAWI